MSDKYWLVIPIVVLFVFSLTMSLMMGFDRGIDQMQQEAILAGHAEWVSDESGKPRFKWKEAK